MDLKCKPPYLFANKPMSPSFPTCTLNYDPESANEMDASCQRYRCARYIGVYPPCPGTKKDAGTAIWALKLSPLGFRKVLYYLRPLAAASWLLGFRLQHTCCKKLAPRILKQLWPMAIHRGMGHHLQHWCCIKIRRANFLQDACCKRNQRRQLAAASGRK